MAHAGANQGRLSERERYCRSGEEAVIYYHRESVLKAWEAAGRRANASTSFVGKARSARRALVGIR
jgi:hypothetical protein